jgi:hypothetical protein
MVTPTTCHNNHPGPFDYLGPDPNKPIKYYRCPVCDDIFGFNTSTNNVVIPSFAAKRYIQQRYAKRLKKVRKVLTGRVRAASHSYWEGTFGGIGRRIRTHILEFSIPVIIGLALVFFGFWSFGAAIVLIAFYLIFRRTPANGPLKFSIIILAFLEFVWLHPISLVALAILFVGYFMFPTSYKEGDAKKGSEAWMRTILGFILSIYLFIAMGGGNTQWPFLFMSLAFFTTFPYIEPRGDSVKIFIGPKGALYGAGGKTGGTIVFAVLMLLALGSIITTWGLDISAITAGVGGGIEAGLSFMLLVFWALSFAFGILAGRQGRPYIGVIMIGIAILLFSFQFTGEVGQSMFGAWWPQVQSTSEMLLGPIGPLFNQAGQGISDAWLMMTCPQCYYEKQLQQQQAGTSNIKTGGTFKSIELTTFDLFSTVLEPSESLLGYLELENQGEFNADRTKVILKATWLSPTAIRGTEPTVVGEVGSMTCSDDITADLGETSSCEWTETIYPTEIKTVSFRFDKNQWTGDNVDLGETEDKSGVTIYTHGTETVKIVADYNYDYNVNVSISLEIINQSLYQTLLKNKQITLQQEESQYSGGPVKATIWTQKQPIRNTEESLIVVSLLNEGKGKITDIEDYTILVPEDLRPEELQYSTFDGCEEEQEFEGGSDLGTEWADYMYISCSHSRSIDSNDFKRISFLIRPKIGSEVDKRTLLIIGKAKYTYSNSQEKSLQIIQAPPQ